MVSDQHWHLLSHWKSEVPQRTSKDMEIELVLPVHCFALPGFSCGFSISSVNTGNGWNRPEKDTIVICKLEEYFPKCRKHTTDGIREDFYLAQRYDMKWHPNSENTFPFSTLIELFQEDLGEILGLLVANCLSVKLQRALGLDLTQTR